MPRRGISIGVPSMGGASEVAELIARVAKLEAEIKDMAARLERLEAAWPTGRTKIGARARLSIRSGR